jgi:glycosyltransferase involved in cell wall biosynthesis
MIEGHDIICFSGDWDGDPLSKKHIMRRLARHNRVLWVNSIGNRNPTPTTRDVKRVFRKLRDFSRDFSRGCRQVMENLYVYSPLVIPFHGNRLARAVNRRLMTHQLRRVIRQLDFRNPITWSFIPSSAHVAGTLGERLVLYHCVDEFSEFKGTDKRAIRTLERELIAKSDAVIVSSAPLLEAKRRHHPNTFMVMHGVEVEHFRQALDARTVVPADIAALPRPVIGFYGLIAEWVDLPLIQRLALARPDWSFVLIGKCDTDVQGLRALPNVHLLGRREYVDLPAYAKGFDVALLPFVVNSLTCAASPLKLREYLAAGLPVVASDIPETRRLAPLAHIATNEEDYRRAIEGILASGRTGPQPEISQAMDRESWDEKVSELSRIVDRIQRARRPWRAVEAIPEASAT